MARLNNKKERQDAKRKEHKENQDKKREEPNLE